jgi:protein-S-isoprenylcysteine O-methyltransferase Ste14
MGRFIALLYGLVCYAVFSFTMLYAVGFVSDVVVPKTIDTGTVVPMAEASVINLFLIFIFAIQHSVMARKQFATVTPAGYRHRCCCSPASAPVWQWHPMPARVWQIADQDRMAVTGLFIRRMLTRLAHS